MILEYIITNSWCINQRDFKKHNVQFLEHNRHKHSGSGSGSGCEGIGCGITIMVYCSEETDSYGITWPSTLPMTLAIIDCSNGTGTYVYLVSFV